jgi:hypothetical protein
MIKARGTSNGRDTVFIGLSFGNLDRFRAQPMDTFIKIDGSEMDLPYDIMIFSGETETQMGDWMTESLSPGAVVHISKRSKQ